MARILSRRPQGVRWGRLSELDGRLRINSPSFRKLPRRLQHLSAWRGMHRLKSHKSIQMTGTRLGIRPSSDLPLKAKIAFNLRKSEG